MKIPLLCSTLGVIFQFTSFFKMTEGSYLKIACESTEDIFIGPDIGVFIDSCSEITFAAMSCNNVHLLLGDGTSQGSYHIIVGGWGNDKSAIRDCHGCSSTTQIFPTPSVLDCHTFRDFWLSWGNDRVALGRGRVPQNDVIFDIPDPHLHDIHTIGFIGSYYSSATYILGGIGKSRFERLMVEGKYTDGEIFEDTVSWVNCSQQCHGHPNCGMFSYNDDLARCALFDRMTSSFAMTSHPGWKSWRMKYCQ